MPMIVPKVFGWKPGVAHREMSVATLEEENFGWRPGLAHRQRGVASFVKRGGWTPKRPHSCRGTEEIVQYWLVSWKGAWVFLVHQGALAAASSTVIIAWWW